MDCHPLPALIVAGLLACTPAVAGVYQWQDAQGRTHFADQPPDRAPAPLRARGDTAGSDERLLLQVTAHGHDLDAADRERLRVGVERLFAVYTGLFRLDMRRQVKVDIHLFPDFAAMQAHLAGRDPGLRLPAGVLGLYAPHFDAVFARAHDGGVDGLLATLLHEASHVMLARLAPDAPPWLHEGLAQYFEGMDLGAMPPRQARITPETHALAAIEAMVAQRQLVTLRDYFALSPERWRHLAHAEQHPVPYAVAWSITWFLMSRPVGRQVVRELLHDLEKTQTSPTLETIERRYPGGYTVMEYDWFRWAQLPKSPQLLAW